MNWRERNAPSSLLSAYFKYFSNLIRKISLTVAVRFISYNAIIRSALPARLTSFLYSHFQGDSTKCTVSSESAR